MLRARDERGRRADRIAHAPRARDAQAHRTGIVVLHEIKVAVAIEVGERHSEPILRVRERRRKHHVVDHATRCVLAGEGDTPCERGRCREEREDKRRSTSWSHPAMDV